MLILKLLLKKKKHKLKDMEFNMLISYIFLVLLISWLVVPFIKDMMGFYQRNDLDVYQAYVKLEQTRQAKIKKVGK